MIEVCLGVARPEFALRLPAEADNLPLLRQGFRSFANVVGIDDPADAELGVTEACANVIKHAYEDGGEVELRLSRPDSRLEAKVVDSGSGIPEPVLAARRSEDGFGLVLMDGVAADLALSSSPSGTTVTMQFPIEGDPPEDGAARHELVLRRIVALLAAQADLSYDRLMEVVMAGELLGRHSLPHLSGEVLTVLADSGPGFVELRSGPYRGGGADAVLADTEVPVIGRVLEKLATSVREQVGEHDEWLELRLEGPAER
jgi:anti-sigma regulatory factor (Ser/Thr protein kinase)